MAALRNAFKSYRDENRFWSYQESLVEAIAVLWISTSISAELVKRHFPDWRASRMDPEQERMGLLWTMLGYGQDRYFWDRALSFWESSNSTVCEINSKLIPAVGYMGLRISLATTALLYIVFFYSLFVNRSWRDPARYLAVPSFYEIAELFRICEFQPKSCKFAPPPPLRLPQPPPPLRPSQDFASDNDELPMESDHQMDSQPGTEIRRCSGNCTVTETAASTCANLVIWILALFLGALAIIPMFIIFVLLFAVAILWLVVLILPVVVLATAATRGVTIILGEDAILPCYVLLALVLTVYSAGRLAGKWARSSYLSQIWNATRKTRGVSSSTDAQVVGESFETVVEPRSPLAAIQILGYLQAGFLFSAYLVVKMVFVAHSTSPTTVQVSLNATNGTDSNSNGTKGLDYWYAVRSYWTKNSTVYDYTILPEPSDVSQAVGEFGYACTIWLPLSCVLLLFVAKFGTDIVHSILMDNMKQQHKSNPANKRYPKWYTYVYGQELFVSQCRCVQALYCIRHTMIFGTPSLVVVLLSFPVLECLVPEQYHLPGLVMINILCVVLATNTGVQFLWNNWRAYQRHPHDPLGDKLSCGQHPLCGNYLRSPGEQKCECGEQGSPGEKQPILQGVEGTGSECSA